MAVQLKLNGHGIEQILKSDRVGDYLENIAEQVADRARGSAPVESGTYRDSIRVERVHHKDRVVAQVIADVDYAVVVESKTGNLARSL